MSEEILAEAIENIITRVMDNYSGCYPGTIVSSNVAGLVDVQPNVSIKGPNNDSEIIPAVIKNVVLLNPFRTSGSIQRPPIEELVGSKVLVITCEHSLTEWRASGGKTKYPSDDRRFNLNDAVAILGLYPETTQWTSPQKPKTYEIMVKEGNKIAIGSQQADLVGLVAKILLDMSAGVNTGTGAFLNIATITPNIAKLQTIANPVS